MQTIFPIFYFPPISYFVELYKYHDNFLLEKHENFIKQTYRNRCVIVGANGKLNLVIPVQHSGERSIKDIKISYAEDWQKLHMKSIKTAYQSTPYFEYYENKILSIFDKKPHFLIDFSLASTEISIELLKSSITINHFSETYKKDYEIDFRTKFIAKKPSEYQFSEYIQVFSDRMPFIQDMSVLDLLCNIGTKSANFIENESNK